VILFDERGERAQKLMVGWQVYRDADGSDRAEWTVVRGHIAGRVGQSEQSPLAAAWGFEPLRSWFPTWFAAKMAKGYRVFELDVGLVEYADADAVAKWWRADEGKRLPHIAAVEMYVRHKAAARG
jgi:hypothetical protein